MAMVDLLEIPEEEAASLHYGGAGSLESHGLVDVMSDMTGQDGERLFRLIERHGHYTNSEKAKLILSDWAAWAPKFKKVMPVEYARALAEMAKAQAADTTGFDVLEIGVGQSKRN
jgi:glutamate synthase (NADPH/NADH) large chain